MRWIPMVVMVLCGTWVSAAGTKTMSQEELIETVRHLKQRVAQQDRRIAELERRGGNPEGDRVRAEAIREIVEDVMADVGTKHPSQLTAYWKDGIRLATDDGRFAFKIGGRIMNDWGWYGDKDDSVGELEDGTEFRRARIYVAGRIYDDVVFKVQYDFAGGDADFKDVYIGLRNVPYVGNIRVGHIKEPFSLEAQTSSKYITFMERGLPNALVPGRNTGVMVFDHAFDQRMTWAVGVFRDADSFGDDPGHDGDYSYTGRVTFLPWYAAKGRKLVHLGAAYSHRSPQDRTLRFRERPEAHLAPRFVDTGNFAAKRVDLINLEAAMVHGPWSVQGEYVQAVVDAVNATNVCFQGFYVYASYFLTGEHRVYKRSAGRFDRVKPKKNFRWAGDRGPGAWEVAARYSYLDLDNKAVHGGRLQDFTLGVNWYLNPNTRVMWNYVFADLADGGDADIFLMRFQLDF